MCCPGNHNYAAVFPETSSAHHMQVFQPPYSTKDEPLELVEEAGVVEKVNGPNKKRQRQKAPKSPKAKKGKRAPQVPKPEGTLSAQRVRSAKKTAEIMINGNPYGHFSHSYTSLLVHWQPSTMLSLGLWWVAISMLYDMLICVSLAYEYEKTWC
ncbi:hypothetical protein OIU76_023018 [Salix suchowensis]|nr:hypothetical protein OIU76_023018 [Salix suchowensis]